MKLKSLCLLLFSVLLFSCQDDNKERKLEQEKEAKKLEVIFNNINRAWEFKIIPLEPETQARINGWNQWRNFITELKQKPKSTIGAFQKKATILSKKTDELNLSLPGEFAIPQVRSRVTALNTKIKQLDLFIHLNQIPDTKVIKLISDIDILVLQLQLQMEEIVHRSQIPIEEGEQDIIRMKDSSRAIHQIPNELP